MQIIDLETGQQTQTRSFVFTEKTLEAHESKQYGIGYLQAKQQVMNDLRELRDSYKKAGKLVEAKAVQRAMEKLR